MPIKEVEKLYKCDITDCDKYFKTKFCLKRHMLKHKVNKKYGCDKCPKRFSLPQYLDEHKNIHN